MELLLKWMVGYLVAQTLQAVSSRKGVLNEPNIFHDDIYLPRLSTIK
jgi:hypothetical protein